MLACSANAPTSSDNSAVVFVTLTPTPTPTPENLLPYRQVMQSAFADDVDEQATKGVTRYKIETTLIPQTLTDPTGPQLSGRMTIKYTNTEPVLLNQIYFRLFPNTPGYGGEMTVLSLEVNQQPVNVQLLAQNSAMEVTLPTPLAPGEQINIFLTYQARLPLTADYGYGMYAYQNNIITLAGFYPVIPVFDEAGWHIDVTPLYGDNPYTDVSLYNVTFIAPAEMTIATSGNILITSNTEDDLQIIRAYSGPMRDFFIAMSPTYQTVSQNVGQIKVSSYYPPGGEETGQFVLEVAAKSLEIFNEYFGPYPYNSFDIVAAPMPETLGGVEFPGVIVLANRYYAESPTDWVEFLTAHEVAHQWWYGLVGNDQVNIPWLDEALTQYSAIHYIEQTYGFEAAQTTSNWYFSSPYRQLLNSGTDRPINGPVSSFSEISYANVVYGKGALFFDTLRTDLGDPLYFAGLRSYAQNNRYSITTPDDLLKAFSGAREENVQFLYREWVLGE